MIVGSLPFHELFCSLKDIAGIQEHKTCGVWEPAGIFPKRGGGNLVD